MLAIAAISAEIVATVLVFALTNLAILAVRDPHKAAWLRSANVQLTIEMLAIGGLLIIVPVLGAGIYGGIANLWLATIVFVGLVVAIYSGLEHLMRMPARLKMCDEGQSPFRGGKGPAAGGAAMGA